jgi:hypothetical protein
MTTTKLAVCLACDTDYVVLRRIEDAQSKLPIGYYFVCDNGHETDIVPLLTNVDELVKWVTL